jgi:hypothetical protein
VACRCCPQPSVAASEQPRLDVQRTALNWSARLPIHSLSGSEMAANASPTSRSAPAALSSPVAARTSDSGRWIEVRGEANDGSSVRLIVDGVELRAQSTTRVADDVAVVAVGTGAIRATWTASVVNVPGLYHGGLDLVAWPVAVSIAELLPQSSPGRCRGEAGGIAGHIELPGTSPGPSRSQ